MGMRKTYPPEYRQRMVELVRAGRSAESLAREFEPTAQSIRNWAKQADLDEGIRSDGLTTAEREELRQLRRDNVRLREEREILKMLDVWSRKIIGWSMGTSLRQRLVLDALGMAITRRQPQGVILHSDQGSQYTSLAFGKRCEAFGIRISMGSVGDCYDNSMAEGSALNCV